MGVRGDVEICRKVPPDVREKLISIQAENSKKLKEKAGNIENLDDEEVTMPWPPSSKKRGIDVNIQKLFKHGVNDHSQPSIQASLQTKEQKHEVDKAFAMWFYKAGVPWNAINYPLFQVALNKTISVGHGYIHPTYHALRVGLLDDAKKSVELIIEGYRKSWKETFQNKKGLYKPYTDVIKARWDGMFRHPLHILTYLLNPAFKYDENNFCKKQHISDSMLEFVILQQKIGKVDATKLLLELQHFQERRLSFANELALQTSKTLRPDEWWKIFGMSTPTLQKLAIKFLSQTASSLGCERNWSTFNWIHSKKRNRLEHQRLNDLVYIYYNLRLQDRLRHELTRAFDLIDYESIDKTEFWIIEEEDLEGELGQEELENMLEGLPIYGRDEDHEVDTLPLPVRDDNEVLQGLDGENEDWLVSYVPEELP